MLAVIHTLHVDVIDVLFGCLFLVFLLTEAGSTRGKDNLADLGDSFTSWEQRTSIAVSRSWESGPLGGQTGPGGQTMQERMPRESPLAEGGLPVSY